MIQKLSKIPPRKMMVNENLPPHLKQIAVKFYELQVFIQNETCLPEGHFEEKFLDLLLDSKNAAIPCIAAALTPMGEFSGEQILIECTFPEGIEYEHESNSPMDGKEVVHYDDILSLFNPDIEIDYLKVYIGKWDGSGFARLAQLKPNKTWDFSTCNSWMIWFEENK